MLNCHKYFNYNYCEITGYVCFTGLPKHYEAKLLSEVLRELQGTGYDIHENSVGFLSHFNKALAIALGNSIECLVWLDLSGYLMT